MHSGIGVRLRRRARIRTLWMLEQVDASQDEPLRSQSDSGGDHGSPIRWPGIPGPGREVTTEAFEGDATPAPVARVKEGAKEDAGFFLHGAEGDKGIGTVIEC